MNIDKSNSFKMWLNSIWVILGIIIIILITPLKESISKNSENIACVSNLIQKHDLKIERLETKQENVENILERIEENVEYIRKRMENNE